MNREKAYVVPMERSTEGQARVLSGLQFNKGLRREEKSYVAILKEHDDEELESQADLLMEVQVVLDKFKDVMPGAFPKKLPPKRKVNHKIELELSTKPPTMSP